MTQRHDAPAVAEHVARGEAAQEGAGEVDGQHAAPLREVEVGELAVVDDARRGDEPVDPGRGLAGAVEGGGDRAGVGHVEGDRQAAGLLGDGGHGRLVAVHQDERREAVGGGPPRDGGPDTPRRARHDQRLGHGPTPRNFRRTATFPID
nr:hypothetical protein [Salipiger mucosus]